MFIAIDTETTVTDQGVPDFVCLSWSDGKRTRVTKDLKVAEQILSKKDVNIVGQNIAFDMAVLMKAGIDFDLVWKAYEGGRVHDTMVNEQLRKISLGWFNIDPNTGRKPMFSLAALAQEYLNENLAKGNDTWRLRYGELIDIPIAKWPSNAVEYARNDALVTWRVWSKMEQQIDLVRQTRLAFGLHLVTARGIATDLDRAKTVEYDLTAKVTASIGELASAGLIRAGKGSKNMTVIKELVSKAYKGSPPATPKGQPKTDRETLERSGNELLIKLAGISNSQKLINTYIPVLKAGRVHSRYSLAASGRTTAYKPNIQNLPREGGIRECFIPSPGHVFVCADYSAIELCALAQVLLWKFGTSYMAQELQAGKDLHLVTAAAMLYIDYAVAFKRRKEPKVKEARQVAKAANFGFVGGLGAESFKEFAKGYGIEIHDPVTLKESWLAAYPEMRQYFKWVAEQAATGGDSFQAESFISGRLRGGVNFTQGCNHYFQALVSDGAKEAIYTAVRARLKVVAFIHDEIIIEAPEAEAHHAAQLLSQIMIDEMQQYIPDIPIQAEAHIMRRWYKNAEPVYNEGGLLIPWEPTL